MHHLQCKSYPRPNPDRPRRQRPKPGAAPWRRCLRTTVGLSVDDYDLRPLRRQSAAYPSPESGRATPLAHRSRPAVSIATSWKQRICCRFPGRVSTQIPHLRRHSRAHAIALGVNEARQYRKIVYNKRGASDWALCAETIPSPSFHPDRRIRRQAVRGPIPGCGMGVSDKWNWRFPVLERGERQSRRAA